MKIKKEIDIYLSRKRPTKTIEVVQFDTGIQLVFSIMDFDVPTGTTAKIFVKKRSGNFVYQEKNITVDGNVITIDLENQAITEYGTTYYQVELINGSDTITTFTGVIEVSKSLNSSEVVESKTVISAFTTLTDEKINEIRNATIEQIGLVQDESATQQGLIEQKGLEVLGTIPEEYTTVNNMAKEAIRTKADAIVLSAEGEAITVNDSSDDFIRGLTIEGKSEQTSYEGKNLLNATLGTNTVNGVTCTANGDGTYTLNGTATDICYFPLSAGFTNLALDTSYRITGCPSGGHLNTYSVYDDKNSYSDNYSRDNGEGKTYIAKAQPKIYMRVQTGCTCNNLLFKPMLTTDLDATYDDFEPYCGGIPSPNPDHPQSINSVADCVEMIQGAFLVQDGSYIGHSFIVTTKDIIPCKTGDVINIKTEILPDWISVLYYKGGVYKSNQDIQASSDCTVTIPEDINGFRFNVQMASNVLITPETVGKIELKYNGLYGVPIKSVSKNLINATLETTTVNGITCANNGNGTYTLNGTATKDTMLVLDTIVLNGTYKLVGCPQGGSGSSYLLRIQASHYDSGEGVIGTFDNIARTINIFIANGYSCNNVLFKPMLTTDLEATYDDFEPYQGTKATLTLAEPLRSLPNGVSDTIECNADGSYKIVRRVGEVTFDGSDDEGWEINTNYGDNTVIWTSISNMRNSSIVRCSHYLYTDAFVSKDYGVTTGQKINIRNINLATLNDFKAWLKSNPITVHYELATPIEEELTAEELNNLKTFYNVTNLSNLDALNPNMILSYNADTKTYIDNKFAELAQQLI